MILRKRRLACVALTCMLKSPMAKKVWTELKEASIRSQPSQFTHISRWKSSKELTSTSNSKVPNRANRSARRAPSAYGSTSTQ